MMLKFFFRRKENTALRAGVSPDKIFVIPNAVDTDMFRPLSTAPEKIIVPKDCSENDIERMF